MDQSNIFQSYSFDVEDVSEVPRYRVFARDTLVERNYIQYLKESYSVRPDFKCSNYVLSEDMTENLHVLDLPVPSKFKFELFEYVRFTSVTIQELFKEMIKFSEGYLISGMSSDQLMMKLLTMKNNHWQIGREKQFKNGHEADYDLKIGWICMNPGIFPKAISIIDLNYEDISISLLSSLFIITLIKTSISNDHILLRNKDKIIRNLIGVTDSGSSTSQINLTVFFTISARTVSNEVSNRILQRISNKHSLNLSFLISSVFNSFAILYFVLLSDIKIIVDNKSNSNFNDLVLSILVITTFLNLSRSVQLFQGIRFSLSFNNIKKVLEIIHQVPYNIMMVNPLSILFITVAILSRYI